MVRPCWALEECNSNWKRTCACTVTSRAVRGSSAMSSAGAMHERHGDEDAPTLAAGKLVGIVAVAEPRRQGGRRLRAAIARGGIRYW